ncbi:MAG: DciA family protein [Candidatus Omnitrophica bacterium]|nr:DciA family protein [Candidatus Omnitrophota bacterium]
MQMELIKETIKGVFENLAAKQKEISSANPEELLKKILTKEEFRHIRIKYFKKGVLCLHADSSSWLYFFNLHKNDLLAGLQKSAPEIKGIRFYLGEVK